MSNDKKILKINFSGLSKQPRTMHVLQMGHRDFFETYHFVIQAAAETLKIGGGRMTFSPFKIVQGLPFEAFENLACKLLRHGVLEGVGTVDSPFESPHFVKHPDELYTAVYSAFVAQNPDMFPKSEEPKAGAGSGVAAGKETAATEE